MYLLPSFLYLFVRLGLALYYQPHWAIWNWVGVLDHLCQARLGLWKNHIEFSGSAEVASSKQKSHGCPVLSCGHALERGWYLVAFGHSIGGSMVTGPDGLAIPECLRAGEHLAHRTEREGTHRLCICQPEHLTKKGCVLWAKRERASEGDTVKRKTGKKKKERKKDFF